MRLPGDAMHRPYAEFMEVLRLMLRVLGWKPALRCGKQPLPFRTAICPVAAGVVSPRFKVDYVVSPLEAADVKC